MIVRPNLVIRRLARGGKTGALSVSRMRDGVVLWTKEATHRGAITDLAWSLDGQWLASGGQDGMVCVWKVSTGDLLHVFPHGEEVRRLRWSSQGMLASASESTIHLWSLAPATTTTV